MNSNLVDQQRGHNRFLNVIYFNARSLPSHIDNIRFLVYKSEIDIMLVTETWLQDNMPINMFEISGYNIFRCDRTYKTHGGVAIYIRDGLSVSQLNVNLADDELNACGSI